VKPVVPARQLLDNLVCRVAFDVTMIEHTTTSAVNSPQTRIALWSGPRSPYGKALSAINALPDDLLLEIFARLSATELLLAGQVSQRWRLLSGTLRVHGRSMRGLL
jgi:hypothetical protein